MPYIGVIVGIRAAQTNAGDLVSILTNIRPGEAIARVDLVRNNRYVYTTSPLQESIEVRFVDMEPEEGLNYYYFRIQQEDGQIAWASPIWVNYEAKK